jgi:hypothetical protein
MGNNKPALKLTGNLKFTGRIDVMNAAYRQTRRRSEDQKAFIACYIEIHESQARSARSELGRLCSLIDDASARLLTSFGMIGDISRSRQVATVNGRDAAARDVDLAVGNAVRALQFQDMATQLVGHAVQRITLLERITESLSRLPDASVDDLRAAVVATTCERHAGPVEQACVSGGSVELY